MSLCLYSFYRVNEVQRFEYSRPIRKGEKNPDNEFAVKTTTATWPGLLRELTLLGRCRGGGHMGTRRQEASAGGPRGLRWVLPLPPLCNRRGWGLVLSRGQSSWGSHYATRLYQHCHRQTQAAQ